MSIRSFTIPTVMKHGLGAINALADEVKELGVKRPLIVTDPGIVQAGLLAGAVWHYRNLKEQRILFMIPLQLVLYTSFFHILFFTCKIRFIMPVMPAILLSNAILITGPMQKAAGYVKNTVSG